MTHPPQGGLVTTGCVYGGGEKAGVAVGAGVWTFGTYAVVGGVCRRVTRAAVVVVVVLVVVAASNTPLGRAPHLVV